MTTEKTNLTPNATNFIPKHGNSVPKAHELVCVNRWNLWKINIFTWSMLKWDMNTDEYYNHHPSATFASNSTQLLCRTLAKKLTNPPRRQVCLAIQFCGCLRPAFYYTSFRAIWPSNPFSHSPQKARLASPAAQKNSLAGRRWCNLQGLSFAWILISSFRYIPSQYYSNSSHIRSSHNTDRIQLHRLLRSSRHSLPHPKSCGRSMRPAP